MMMVMAVVVVGALGNFRVSLVTGVIFLLSSGHHQNLHQLSVMPTRNSWRLAAERCGAQSTDFHRRIFFSRPNHRVGRLAPFDFLPTTNTRCSTCLFYWTSFHFAPTSLSHYSLSLSTLSSLLCSHHNRLKVRLAVGPTPPSKPNHKGNRYTQYRRAMEMEIDKDLKQSLPSPHNHRQQTWNYQSEYFHFD